MITEYFPVKDAIAEGLIENGLAEEKTEKFKDVVWISKQGELKDAPS